MTKKHPWENVSKLNFPKVDFCVDKLITEKRIKHSVVESLWTFVDQNIVLCTMHQKIILEAVYEDRIGNKGPNSSCPMKIRNSFPL